MSNKNLTIGLVIAILIAVGGFFFPKVVSKLTGIQSGVDVTTTNFTSLSTQNGISNGGLYTTSSQIGLTTGTTTVCAIQSPNATSTLSLGAVSFTTSSTTASKVYLARATTAYATTTNINLYSVAANAAATIVASSTGSVAGDATIFPPSTYFVVGMAGGTGTFSPIGACTAEFKVTY